MQIYVYNKSTVVSNHELNIMVTACNTLIKKFCFIWNILPVTITALTKIQHVNYLFYIVDNSVLPSSLLAYHTEINGKVIGYIMAKTIINSGGTVLHKDKTTFTVAASLFHEIAESLIDPTVNIWWQLNNIYLVAAEVCDPVQNNLVLIQTADPITKKTIDVALSDFIYPSWFDPMATPNSGIVFNYTNTLTKPFSISTGGSVVLLNTKSNALKFIFGKKVPAWQKKMKHASNRIMIRKHHVTKQLVNITKPVITEIDDQ